MLLISTAPTAPGRLRLHVDGELDIFAAQDLRRALSMAIGQAVTSIEVDLSGSSSSTPPLSGCSSARGATSRWPRRRAGPRRQRRLQPYDGACGPQCRLRRLRRASAEVAQAPHAPLARLAW